MVNKLIILFCSLLILSCRKVPEKYLSKDIPHLSLKFNSRFRLVPACGSSYYAAQYFGDTTFFAAFHCAGNGISFYLKGNNKDGSYVLNNHNSTTYSEDYSNTFLTDSLHKGILNIKTEMINSIVYVRGSFEFEGFDSVTKNTCKITEGEFLLSKYH